MISRFKDPSLLDQLCDAYPEELGHFDVEDWIANDDNYAYTDGENVGLVEKSSDGVHTAHYFFVVRGKAAKRLAIEMLDNFFNTTDVNLLRGLTPLPKVGARWMNRQVGFKAAGVVQTFIGPCELFVLSKQDFFDRIK